jgi:hypothetical protein
MKSFLSLLKTASLAACFLASFSVLLAPAASARELRIEQFDSKVFVMADGSIRVTETIQVQFIGSWRGLYRDIPVEYVTPQGFNYSLFLDVTRITDGEGNVLKFDSSRERHYRKLKIYVPGALDARKTIVIEYTVADALRFFEDHDELYWNVTGDEWDVPIQSATAKIFLPEGTTGIRVNRFTGAYRSREQEADVDVAGIGVEVRTQHPLAYHEGLTVAVAFDKGFVHAPTAADKAILFFRSNWPLAVPLFVFMAMFLLWWNRGRDPRLRPISAQYEPPEKLTPGEVGTLLDDSVDMRDITATLVDLAVRGFMVITEEKKDHLGGLWSDKDYIFTLQKSRSEWNGLKGHEEALLTGIFTAGQKDEMVSMSSLQNRFYTTLPLIKNSLFDSLVTHGYYGMRPDSTRSGWIAFGVVIGFLSIWGGGALGKTMGMAPLAFIVSGILSAAMICGFGWLMPARTADGTRALEGVLGFEDFLAHVESDRFNTMIKTPQMFEKFLPFAMALGVEKNWSKAFQGICVEPPSWYRGGTYSQGFYPMYFASSLNSMSTSAASVMASAPRSSGGSGFGGGGGGGGGFGGGGGGGF